MTHIHTLKVFVNKRLTAAAEEIFGMFEKTIIEHYAEVSRLNEELNHQRRQLETALKPDITVLRAEPQQIRVNGQEEDFPPELQHFELGWNSDVILVKEELELPQIKEEEEEFLTSLCEQQHLEYDTEEFTFTQTCVRSDVNDEQTQFSDPDQTRSVETTEGQSPHKLTNQSKGKHAPKKLPFLLNSSKVYHPESLSESHSSYCCKVCEKTFHYKGNLVRHVRLHAKDKCLCGVCGDSFLEGSELKAHLRTHKSFQCTVCGKMSVNSSNLKVHMRTHTEEKPHCCKMCGRGFKQMGHLIVHMRMHTREKPHCCNVCGRGFNQMVHLSVHMRTHTGEKPFPCHVCGKGFVSRGNLVQHIRVHSGEKPYMCSDCGRNFTKRTSLNYHMTTHVGKKTFCCHVCGKDVCTSKDMKKHMLIHIGKKTVFPSVRQPIS